MLRTHQSGFTIMVAGTTSLGKSSFLNTLFDQEIAAQKHTEGKKSSFNIYMLESDFDGGKKTITMIDTPSFGNELDDTRMHENIRNYLRTQFDSFLAEESKIRRNPYFEDTRVHCLLYFIAPNVHGLTKNDVDFLKTIDNLVNIIPVVGKADGLTQIELETLRNKVMQQIKEEEIKIFEFDKEPFNKNNINNNILNRLPFAMVTAEFCGGDETFRGRKFPWGVININDPTHCDFRLVKEILLSTYIDSLVEKTVSLLYEDYRSSVLSEYCPEK